MRLDPELQYRLWVAEDPNSPGSSGTFRAEDHTLIIRKTDGTCLSARISLQGPDTVVLQHAGGKAAQTYTRRRDDPKPPGEGTGGRSLTEADRKDPQKCFAEGERLYDGQNMKEAAEWFLRAARLGHAKAQLQIGWHFETGIGVRQDFGAALEWYRKSADQGNGQAMSNLGTLCEDGLGTRQDWVQAAQWYRRGADANTAQACSRLARAYRFGIGVHQDRSRAIEWYRRAAALGDASSGNEAQWLGDPSNSVGFASEEEHALVIKRLPRTSELWGDMGSAGLLFHDAAERMKWALQLQKRVADDEASIDAMCASWMRHDTEVKRLEREGYSHEDAERRAGW
jgi:TPR repeat protein